MIKKLPTYSIKPDDPLAEDSEFIARDISLREILELSTKILTEITKYSKSITKFVCNLRKVAKSFSDVLPEGYVGTELAINSANQAKNTMRVGLVMSEILLKSTAIEPLQDINEKAKELMELGKKRHKFRVAMQKSDIKLEKFKRTDYDPKALEKKVLKNQKFHDDYLKAHDDFISRADLLISKRQAIFGKAYAAFQYYVLQFAKESDNFEYEQMSKFPFQQFSQHFQIPL